MYTTLKVYLSERIHRIGSELPSSKRPSHSHYTAGKQNWEDETGRHVIKDDFHYIWNKTHSYHFKSETRVNAFIPFFLLFKTHSNNNRNPIWKYWPLALFCQCLLSSLMVDWTIFLKYKKATKSRLTESRSEGLFVGPHGPFYFPHRVKCRALRPVTVDESRAARLMRKLLLVFNNKRAGTAGRTGTFTTTSSHASFPNGVNTALP